MSRRTNRSSKACVALVAALFFLLRFVWVPVHVAFEPHTDFHGCVALKAAASGAEPTCREGDGDHLPHPAADHEIDIPTRPLDFDESTLLMPAAIYLALDVEPLELGKSIEAAREPAHAPPRRARRARAPPAA